MPKSTMQNNPSSDDVKPDTEKPSNDIGKIKKPNSSSEAVSLKKLATQYVQYEQSKQKLKDIQEYLKNNNVPPNIVNKYTSINLENLDVFSLVKTGQLDCITALTLNLWQVNQCSNIRLRDLLIKKDISLTRYFCNFSARDQIVYANLSTNRFLLKAIDDGIITIEHVVGFRAWQQNLFLNKQMMRKITSIIPMEILINLTEAEIALCLNKNIRKLLKKINKDVVFLLSLPLSTQSLLKYEPLASRLLTEELSTEILYKLQDWQVKLCLKFPLGIFTRHLEKADKLFELDIEVQTMLHETPLGAKVVELIRANKLSMNNFLSLDVRKAKLLGNKDLIRVLNKFNVSLDTFFSYDEERQKELGDPNGLTAIEELIKLREITLTDVIRFELSRAACVILAYNQKAWDGWQKSEENLKKDFINQCVKLAQEKSDFFPHIKIQNLFKGKVFTQTQYKEMDQAHFEAIKFLITSSPAKNSYQIKKMYEDEENFLSSIDFLMTQTNSNIITNNNVTFFNRSSISIFDNEELINLLLSYNHSFEDISKFSASRLNCLLDARIVKLIYEEKVPLEKFLSFDERKLNLLANYHLRRVLDENNISLSTFFSYPVDVQDVLGHGDNLIGIEKFIEARKFSLIDIIDSKLSIQECENFTEDALAWTAWCNQKYAWFHIQCHSILDFLRPYIETKAVSITDFKTLSTAQCDLLKNIKIQNLIKGNVFTLKQFINMDQAHIDVLAFLATGYYVKNSQQIKLLYEDREKFLNVMEHLMTGKATLPVITNNNATLFNSANNSIFNHEELINILLTGGQSFDDIAKFSSKRVDYLLDERVVSLMKQNRFPVEDALRFTKKM